MEYFIKKFKVSICLDRRPSNVLNLPRRGQSEVQVPSELTSNEGKSSAGSTSGAMMSQK